MRRISAVSNLKSAARRGGQTAVRKLIGGLTPWPRLENPVDGYSIILGVPWMLRHILDVNLRAIARCDLSRLIDIHVVLDRTEQPGMREFAELACAQWKDLPLRFAWYPDRTGRICERANVSTFYNGLNILTALSHCRTRAAVLHDFDLYPLRGDYFEALASGVLDRRMRFSGLERTRFDGLRESDDIFGTWGLAMDAAWLRNERRPAEILHRQAPVRGRYTRLDPFSWLQLDELHRDAVRGVTPDDVCHVKNLCSSFLRLKSGKPVYVAWRLHYLAYLEDVSLESDRRMREFTLGMEQATGPVVSMYGHDIDFSGVEPTCANVLRRELFKLDEFLFGEVRPVVRDFVEHAELFFRGAGRAQAEPPIPATTDRSASTPQRERPKGLVHAATAALR